MPYLVSPEEQPKFPHSVRIGQWAYPSTAEGQFLTECPLCHGALQPPPSVPGHVCGKVHLTEQEYLELLRAQADAERLRKLTS